VLDRATVEAALRETVVTALGRGDRADPVLPGTGGPAGNARLTAWTGLVLLVLFIAELVTLLDVRGWIDWHLAVGVLLIPPALLKTATTGWRILRYYTGNAPYRSAGPPPLLLRLFGPLVVLSTLALLGTGLALVLVGEADSRRTISRVVGQRVDVLTLHQAAFAVWAVATGLHVLARVLPAWRASARGAQVPGAAWRGVALVAVGALGVAAIGWVLANAGDWRAQRDFRPPPGQHRDSGLRPGRPEVDWSPARLA
jgi:hypothetical protein